MANKRQEWTIRSGPTKRAFLKAEHKGEAVVFDAYSEAEGSRKIAMIPWTHSERPDSLLFQAVTNEGQRFVLGEYYPGQASEGGMIIEHQRQKA